MWVLWVLWKEIEQVMQVDALGIQMNRLQMFSCFTRRTSCWVIQGMIPLPVDKWDTSGLNCELPSLHKLVLYLIINCLCYHLTIPWCQYQGRSWIPQADFQGGVCHCYLTKFSYKHIKFRIRPTMFLKPTNEHE